MHGGSETQFCNILEELLVYLIAHGWEVNMLINLGDITCIGFGGGAKE